MSVALQVEENEVLELINFGIRQCGGHGDFDKCSLTELVEMKV